jgi:hypothetical protein
MRAFRLPRTSWSSCVMLVVLLLAGCTVAQPRQQTGNKPLASQDNGINIRGDSSRIVIATPELMCQAPLVIDVGVSIKGKSHWNTPDASRPQTRDAKTILEQGFAIYTPIQFSHMHIHIDHRHQPTKEFATIGGDIGPDHYWLDDPQVVAGQAYLLVLVPGIDPIGHAYKEDTYLVTDAFPIDAQGMVQLQPQLIEQGQVTQQEKKVPLTELAQQLASCK